MTAPPTVNSTITDQLAAPQPGKLAALKQILFKPATRQKMLAFASLLALLVFFSLASPNFLQYGNMVGILQSTAVNGVLAIACTFVIITAGIDLSVGTMMTFCIYFNSTPDFPVISQESLIGYFIPALPIPNAVLIMFVVAAIASIVLNKTLVGRYTFALGSNEEAVRLSGVNVAFWKIVVYSISGAICGIAGLLIASRLNSAQPALGQGYELDAIAAVVIGGTSLSGGTGTILGTIIGAFIMSVLTNGLRIMSVAQEWQTVLTGLIIILAVYTDILRRGKT